MALACGAQIQNLEHSPIYWFSVLIVHVNFVLEHYLFQGLLDLHGALYNPNCGIYLGHLPAVNFMDFVKDVTEHLAEESKRPPYKLEVATPKFLRHVHKGSALT